MSVYSTSQTYEQNLANDPGLLGWWKFNETSGTVINDSSTTPGSGNTGTYPSGTSLAQPSIVPGSSSGYSALLTSTPLIGTTNAANLNYGAGQSGASATFAMNVWVSMTNIVSNGAVAEKSGQYGIDVSLDTNGGDINFGKAAQSYAYTTSQGGIALQSPTTPEDSHITTNGVYMLTFAVVASPYGNGYLTVYNHYINGIPFGNQYNYQDGEGFFGTLAVQTNQGSNLLVMGSGNAGYIQHLHLTSSALSKADVQALYYTGLQGPLKTGQTFSNVYPWCADVLPANASRKSVTITNDSTVPVWILLDTAANVYSANGLSQTSNWQYQIAALNGQGIYLAPLGGMVTVPNYTGGISSIAAFGTLNSKNNPPYGNGYTYRFTGYGRVCVMEV